MSLANEKRGEIKKKKKATIFSPGMLFSIKLRNPKPQTLKK